MRYSVKFTTLFSFHFFSNPAPITACEPCLSCNWGACHEISHSQDLFESSKIKRASRATLVSAEGPLPIQGLSADEDTASVEPDAPGTRLLV